jgi:hypothetical protein
MESFLKYSDMFPFSGISRLSLIPSLLYFPAKDVNIDTISGRIGNGVVSILEQSDKTLSYSVTEVMKKPQETLPSGPLVTADRPEEPTP